MFVPTVVCVLFLIKLRWPKTNSIYDLLDLVKTWRSQRFKNILIRGTGWKVFFTALQVSFYHRVTWGLCSPSSFFNKYYTLHYITLHYITLHYITLHYVTLHYITLHYITLQQCLSSKYTCYKKRCRTPLKPSHSRCTSWKQLSTTFRISGIFSFNKWTPFITA